MTYQVNEIFTSVQGEGVRVGIPSTFIRLQGCTVGCPWCDTKYTWQAGGTRMTVPEIIAQVNTDAVVITGGEPTLYNLDELIAALHMRGHFVQMETSGQNDFKGRRRPDWTTWSPKPNLHWRAPDGIITAAKEVKFVVDQTLSFEIVHDMTAVFDRGVVPPFVLMPEGTPPKPEFVAATMDILSRTPQGEDWRFGDRLQWRLGVR